MAYNQPFRLPDGQAINLYGPANGKVTSIKMNGTNLELSSTGIDTELASGSSFIINNGNVVFKNTAASIGGASGIKTLLSIGANGDTVDLSVSGVTYKVATLTGNVNITGNLTIRGSELNLGGTSTVIKNGSMDFTDAPITFSRDTDFAKIEFIDYGADDDALTFTFGDRPTDYVRFRNDSNGTGTYVNIMDVKGDNVVAYKPIKVLTNTNVAGLVLEGNQAGWGSGLLLRNTTDTTGKTFGMYSSSAGKFHLTDESVGARLVIDGSGNMGIGVTSPKVKLDVSGDIHTNQGAFIYYYDSATNVDHIWHDDTAKGNTPGVWHFASDVALKADGNATLQAGAIWMTVNTPNYIAGNTGIGLSNPATTLEVMAPTNGTTLEGNNRFGGVHLRATAETDGFTGITSGAVGANTNTTQAGILFQNSGAYGTKMHFLTTNSFANGMKNKMTLDQNGKLGIGTTTPTEQLSVVGNMHLTGSIFGKSTTARTAIYTNTTSADSGSWIEMYGMDGSARQGELTLSGNYLSFRTGSNGTVTGSEVMTLKGSELSITGSMKATGVVKAQNLLLGTTGVNQGNIYNLDILSGYDDIRFAFGDSSTSVSHTMTSKGLRLGNATSNPQYTLDVIGDAGIDGLLEYIGLATSDWREGGNIGYMNRLSGRLVNVNPDFFFGTDNGYQTYDNGGSGRVVRTIVTDDVAPNSSGKIMRISYDPARNPDKTTTPGYGGFAIALSRDTGDLSTYAYRAGNRYIYRINAKIPVGRNIEFGTNSTGNNARTRWLTSQAGTGKWNEYIMVQLIGETGTFSSTGFWHVKDGTDVAFTWDVASCQMIAMDEVADVDRAPYMNVGYKMGKNLGWGELYATGDATIDKTLTVGGSANFTGSITTDGEIIGSKGLKLQYANGGMEIGALGVANTPYIDFHSGATTTDYDARFISVGGNGTNGGADLSVHAATFKTLKDLSVGGDLIIPKSGTTATIRFPVASGGYNDPAYIQHIESPINTGIMRFSASDDPGDTDYFQFGAREGASFLEGARITTAGNATLKNTTVDTFVANNNATINGNLIIPTTSANQSAIKLGNVSIGQQTANSDQFIMTNLGQFRFGDVTDWSYNKWAGFKYNSSLEKLIIGGPASPNFSSNASPPKIDLSFEGIKDIYSDASIKITLPNTKTIGGNNLANSWIYMDNGMSQMGLDSNEIVVNGADLFVGTVGATDVIFCPTNTERMRITNTGNVGIGTATPGGKFHVSHTTMSMIVQGDSVSFKSQGTQTTKTPYLEWRHADGVRSAYMGYGTKGSHWEIILENGHNMYIGGGKVGIGTSTPSEMLDVNGKIKTNSEVIATGQISTNNNFNVISTGSYGYILPNNKKMYSNGADSWIRFDSDIYTGTGIIRTDGELQSGQGGANFRAGSGFMAWKTNVLYANGSRVGIGTTTPSHPLEVVSALTHQGINIKTTDATLVNGLSYQNPDGQYTWHLASGPTANSDFIISGFGTNANLSALGENARFYTNGDFRTRGKVILNRTTVDQNPSISVAIGDSDTGFNWVGDGNLDFYANNTSVANITSSKFWIKKTTQIDALTTINNRLVVSADRGENPNYTNGHLELKNATSGSTNDIVLGFHRIGATASSFIHTGDQWGSGQMALTDTTSTNRGTLEVKRTHYRDNTSQKGFTTEYNATEDSLDFVYLG